MHSAALYHLNFFFNFPYLYKIFLNCSTMLLYKYVLASEMTAISYKLMGKKGTNYL